jgi:TonB-linked SusC/RagA family outer membrane protein
MYRNQTDPEKYPSVDWQDQMLRDNAKSTKYGVNISGGTDFVKYFTSLAYTYDGDMLATENTNNRGYSPEFRYDRYNFRTNLDFTLTKTTNFKVSLSGYFGKQQESGGSIHGMWYGVYKHSPTAVPRYSDGSYGSDELSSERFGINSFREVNTNGSKTNTRTSIISDFELNQKLDFITKGLSFRGRFSFDNYFATTGRNITDNYTYITKRYDIPTEAWQYNVPTLAGHGFDQFPSPLGYTSETPNGGSTKRNLYYETSINYSRKFGKHNVGAMALFSRERFATGSSFPSMREDWVGRVTYDYDGRYLLEVNGAYNGSEKFGPEYKFDFFPSLALGWRVSEENFIKENVPQISNLKIKYSLGQVGNDRLSGVGQWPFVTTWVSGYPTGLGGDASQNFGYPTGVVSPYPVYREGTPGNPDLHWEASTKQNIGVEFGFFKDLITGTFDYFKEHRTDMLVGSGQRNIPEYVGGVAPAANIGEVKSHGMEVDVKIQKKFGKVNLWASYNWTQAINTIIKKEDSQLAPSYQKQAGFSIGQSRSQVIDHIVTSWDDMYKGVMYESSSTNAYMLPGDYRMLDYNSDGIINGLDNIALEYTQYPQNTYGFALGGDYKGISLMVQFYGNYNVNTNQGQLAEFDFNAPIIYQSLLDRSFVPEYQNSDVSYRALQIKRNAPSGNGMLYDASFLRLKTAEMQNVRIYANGNNLLFWSKLPYDVEGDDAEIKRYPNTKQINLGLNVTF